jgi:hypothetical protein
MEIDKAIKIFSGRPTFQPELARAMFWKSKIMEALGKRDEAHSLRDESLHRYGAITGTALSEGKLDNSHWEYFNNLVTFWSR